VAGGGLDNEYADKDGTAIAYRVVGDGPVDLIFSAGLACHLDLLQGDPHCDAWVRRLSQVGRLILFDKPGTGLSDPLTSMPTVADRAADYLAVLDAVGSRRAVVLGLSEAGAPAVLLAAQHPERVEAVVTISSPPRFTIGPDYLPHLEEYVEGHVWSLLWHSASHWGDGTFLLNASPWFSRSAVYRRLAPTIERACASPAMARTIIHAVRGYDVLAACEAVRAPTLILNRSEEWTPPDIARDLADRIAGSSLAVLPGDEHLCFFGGDDILDEIERFLGGGRPARPRSDRSLQTLLFTDIVGSTGAAVAMGDERWRGLLTQLDGAARDAVDRLGGRVVKGTGDGILAAFDRPATAIRAAEAMHAAAGSLGLDIRAGLHTGECDRVGDDLAGIAVHIAARVAALAGAGETLATATVRDLVLGSDVAWTDRGEHELRGVPGRWRLVALADEDAASPVGDVVATSEPRKLSERVLLAFAGRAPAVSRAAMRAAGRVRSRSAP
jgi:class 3 adenylate cyclase